MKYCIILTTTVNCQENIYCMKMRNPEIRKKIYVKAIKQWLEKTQIPIIVVENSGYLYPEIDRNKYDENRLEIITFHEENEPDAVNLKNNTSKGYHEMYSIIYAYRNSKKIIDNVDFIIKITGRYFISDFEKTCDNFLKKGIYFIQQSNENNCEIIGCHKHVFGYLFDLDYHDPQDYVEMIYKKRMENMNPLYIWKCPQFEIEATISGGWEFLKTQL